MQFGYKVPADPSKLEQWAGPLFDAGLTWLEFGAWQADEPAFASALRRVIRSYKPALSVHCRFLDTNLSAEQPAVREAVVQVLRHDIDVAAAFGARLAVVHSGNTAVFMLIPPDHPFHARMEPIMLKQRAMHTQLLRASLCELAGYAAQCGVRVTVENTFAPWEIVTTPAQAREVLCDGLQGKVGLTLDLGHALLLDIEPLEFVDALGAEIWHTHIHSNDRLFDMHLPPGEGCLALKPVLPRILSMNPDITFLLEIAEPRFDDLMGAGSKLADALA